MKRTLRDHLSGFTVVRINGKLRPERELRAAFEQLEMLGTLASHTRGLVKQIANATGLPHRQVIDELSSWAREVESWTYTDKFLPSSSSGSSGRRSRASSPTCRRPTST